MLDFFRRNKKMIKLYKIECTAKGKKKTLVST
nr:MAG TPA: hypothetical protein [Caudoviricetes sp.]